MPDTIEIFSIALFIESLVSLFIFMITKSYYHFDYLKQLNPDKLKKYGNYFDTFNMNELFNQYRVSLLFPVFKRYRSAEDMKEMEKIIKKVKFFCKATIYTVLFIILYVVVLLTFWGDFS